MKSKNIFLFFVSIFLGFAFICYLFYQVDIKKIIQNLSLLSLWQIIIIFLINIFIFLTTILKWQILVKPYNYKSSLTKIIPIFLSEWTVSYLTPIMYVGGEGLKAHLVSKNEKQSFIKTFSLIIVDRIAEGVALLLFLIFGGTISFLLRHYLLGSLLIIFSILVIVLIFFASKLSNLFLLLNKIFKFYKITNQENKDKSPEEKIKEEIKIIEEFFRQKIKFFNLDVILSFLCIILACIQIYFLMSFFGYRLDFFKIFLIRTFIVFSGFIPTPASLGGFEGSMAFIFNLLGFRLEHALSFSLVIRFVQLIFVIFGIFFIIPYLTSLVIPLIFKNHKKC